MEINHQLYNNPEYGVQQGKNSHSPADSLICTLLYTLSHKVVTLGTRCTPSEFRAGDTQEIPILNITKFFFNLISYQISRPTEENFYDRV